MNTTSTTNTTPTTTARRRLGFALAGVALASSAVTGAVVASARDSAAASVEHVAVPGYASFGVPSAAVAVPGYASFGVPSEPVAPRRGELSADVWAKVAEFPPYLVTQALLQLANA